MQTLTLVQDVPEGPLSLHRTRTYRRVEVAIIGAGAGGAECVRTIVEAMGTRGSKKSVRITTYDRRHQIGRGVAWANGYAPHVCNMPARTMTVSPSQHDQIAQSVGIRTEHTGSIPLPRSMVGDALANRYQDTREKAAAAGIKVEHVPSVVLDILRSGKRFVIVGENGMRRTADYVVLAIGNVPPTNFLHLRGMPGYHANPWDTRQILDTIPDIARVAVLGTGPTSIDIAIALSEWGHLGPITFYSKSGKVPWVRPRYDIRGTSQVVSVTRIERMREAFGPLSWYDVQRMLLQEAASPGVTLQEIQRVRLLSDHLSPRDYLLAGLAEANQHPEWFNVLKRLDEVLPHLWNALSDTAKTYVQEKVRREHARISYAIPAQNAERLVQLLDIGALRVIGGFESVEYAECSGRFLISRAGVEQPDQADVVINATGLGTDVDKMDNSLVQRLRQSGMLSRHPFGGTNADFHTGEVIGEDEKTVDGLFALAGSLTIGVQGFVNALLKVSKSAIRTGEAIADRVAATDHKGGERIS